MFLLLDVPRVAALLRLCGTRKDHFALTQDVGGF